MSTKEKRKRFFHFSKPAFFSIDKRQKFVVGTALLSLGLFFTEYQLSISGIIAALLLAFFTNIILFWAIHNDIQDKKNYEVFILPLFYSLAFGLFYFLTPAAFFSRLILTVIYAFGLYSLFLSQNILIVSSSRTIALLSGSRIVSFVVTLVSYFLLTNTIFTFHITIFPVILILLTYTYLLVYHSLWTYTLQKNSQPLSLWASSVTVCLVEVATILWFWPSNPTVISLFLTGFFYAILGLSHIWFERRLFKGILWEYVWVGCVVFFVLMIFTPWGK
ncbi:MAG: hypothetical protein AAB553_03520 [Patescibacteria group bacterium]